MQGPSQGRSLARTHAERRRRLRSCGARPLTLPRWLCGQCCVDSWPAGQLRRSALHAVCPPCAPLPFRSVWPTTKLRCASVTFARAFFAPRPCTVLGAWIQLLQYRQQQSTTGREVRVRMQQSRCGAQTRQAHTACHSTQRE